MKRRKEKLPSPREAARIRKINGLRVHTLMSATDSHFACIDLLVQLARAMHVRGVLPAEMPASILPEAIRELENTLAQVAGVHRDRYAEFTRSIARQVDVHQTEIVALIAEVTVLRQHLKTAVSLVDSSQRDEWTPACTKSLEECRLISIGV